MASRPVAARTVAQYQGSLPGLSDPRLSIGGPAFDALLFWGIPILALVFVQLWLGAAIGLPEAKAKGMVNLLVLTSAVLTYAHLIGVAPRAYLNRQVFESNRLKLTLVPLLLICALFLSPAILVMAGVVAIFWDIHHSAMQNFGLSRIYDMKAGNDAQVLRRTDLRLNWFLYVGPLAGGAALMTHVRTLGRLEDVGLDELARLPGLFSGHLTMISAVAVAAWLGVIAWSILDYRRAMAKGYRLPVHKAALLATTGFVSLIAWGFSSPLVALVSINIYHAVQYFALVWLKEGERMSAVAGQAKRLALPAFLIACLGFGALYQLAATASAKWLLAPFIACSLLHFWYDSFVWSVSKKQV